MSDPQLRWLRLWTDIISDPKIVTLAFEDRWHYVALLCMKRRGDLDQPDRERRNRYVSVTLGVTHGQVLDELKKRLIDADLIDKNWQPRGWEKRQFHSDQSDPTVTLRMRRYRERQRNDRNATVTPLLPESEQSRAEIKPPLPPLAGGDLANAHSPRGSRSNGTNPRAQNVAGEIFDYLAANGGGPKYRGQSAVESALEAIGGWQAIRMRTADEGSRLRRRFCDAYYACERGHAAG